MKLYTAWEVWEDVPNEDYDNLAHKKEWVRMVDLIDLFKEYNKAKQNIKSDVEFICKIDALFKRIKREQE